MLLKADLCHLMILTVMAPRLEASNAFLRAHISYRTQPMAQTSVLLSYARPCSMQTGLCQSNAGMGKTGVKQLACCMCTRIPVKISRMQPLHSV